MDYNEIREAIKNSSFTSEHYRRLIVICGGMMSDPAKVAEAAKDLIDEALAVQAENFQDSLNSSGGATT